VTDALLLARHADATVLVVQQNKVDRALIKRALALLRRTTPNVIGAVLNAVEVKGKAYYGYYGSQKDRKGVGGGRGPAGPRTRSGTDAGAPEVTDASIV